MLSERLENSHTRRESRTEITVLFTWFTNNKHREQTKAHFIVPAVLMLSSTDRFSASISMVQSLEKENWEAFCKVMRRKCSQFIVLPRTPEGALCVSICKNRPYVYDLLTNLKAKSTCYKPPVLPFFCALCYCLNKTHHFRKCQVQVLYQDANCGKSAHTFTRKPLGENVYVLKPR